MRERDMPTYEYECTRCGDRFDRKKSFSDDLAETCPRCDAMTRRVFSAVPIIFKGSGFYMTDSRTKPATSDQTSPKEQPAAKPDTATVEKKGAKPATDSKTEGTGATSSESHHT
jgi:putative FmdB family regulatory protein